MTRYDLLTAIGELPEELVLDATAPRKRNMKPVIATVTAFAACFLIAVIVSFSGLLSFIFGAGAEDPNYDGSSGSSGAPAVVSSVYYVKEGQIVSREMGITDLIGMTEAFCDLNSIDGQRIYFNYIMNLNGSEVSATEFDSRDHSLTAEDRLTVYVTVSGEGSDLFEGTGANSVLECLEHTLSAYLENKTGAVPRICLSVE